LSKNFKSQKACIETVHTTQNDITVVTAEKHANNVTNVYKYHTLLSPPNPDLLTTVSDNTTVR